MVQRLQSDPGGGGGREKQRIPLVNKTRGLATRKGEGGRSRLALKARGRVSKTERDRNGDEMRDEGERG